jgi:hypothetical protein
LVNLAGVAAAPVVESLPFWTALLEGLARAMGDKGRTLKEITPRSQDFSQWYLDVVLKAEMA